MRTEQDKKRLSLACLPAVKNNEYKTDNKTWTVIVSAFFAIVVIEQTIFEKTVDFQ